MLLLTLPAPQQLRAPISSLSATANSEQLKTSRSYTMSPLQNLHGQGQLFCLSMANGKHIECVHTWQRGYFTVKLCCFVSDYTQKARFLVFKSVPFGVCPRERERLRGSKSSHSRVFFFFVGESQ